MLVLWWCRARMPQCTRVSVGWLTPSSRWKKFVWSMRRARLARPSGKVSEWVCRFMQCIIVENSQCSGCASIMRTSAFWVDAYDHRSWRAWEILENAWIWNKNFKALESAQKQIRCLKVLENPWKVLEFKSCKFWHFAFVDNFEAVFQYELQTNWWRQSVTCFYHYGIGEYSTVHFSVTLQSKFWMSTSTIWLFVDNFGAWRMQVGSLKVLEKCLNFVL